MKDRIVNGISDAYMLDTCSIIKKKASNYYKRLIDDAYTIDDIYQCIDMTVCKAREKFDHNINDDFRGYAWYIVDKALKNLIISRSKKMRLYESGEDDGDEEESDDIEDIEEEYTSLDEDPDPQNEPIVCGSKFATFKTIGYDDDNDCEFDIPDKHYSIMDKLKILDENIDTVISDKIDRKIIRMKFGIGIDTDFDNSDRAIGEMLGMNTVSVNTRLKRTIDKLTHYFNG